MEAVVFTGLQASGKSSFYMERFFRTHVRLNLDMLKTAKRESILLQACLAAEQPFVIDRTNPLRKQRRRYAEIARASAFEPVLYVFETDVETCLERNEARDDDARVPEVAIRGTAAKSTSSPVWMGAGSPASRRCTISSGPSTCESSR